MAVHRPPTKLDKLASRQPNFRPDAPSPPPDSVPAFSPTARRLPLHRAEVTDVFYTPAVPRPNSPAIIVKSNTPDSSRLSRRGTSLTCIVPDAAPFGLPSGSLSSAPPSLRFSTFPKGLDSPCGPTFGCSISRLPRRSIVFPLGYALSRGCSPLRYGCLDTPLRSGCPPWATPLTRSLPLS